MTDALQIIDAMLDECDQNEPTKNMGGRRLGGGFGARLGWIIRRAVIREVRDRITGEDPSHWPADPLAPGESRVSDLFPHLESR